MPPAPKVRPLPPQDEFNKILSTIDNLKVDGSDMASINLYLAGLAEMTKVVQKKVKAADAEAQLGDPSQTPYATLSRHDVGGVLAISEKLRSTEKHLTQNLAKFADALEHTAGAVTKIAEAYGDRDKLNKMSAEQALKLLA